MKKILLTLLLMSSLGYSKIQQEVIIPKGMEINKEVRPTINGIPLGIFTKKGRDTETRAYKLAGYQISGKVDAARKIYSYFIDYVSQQEEVQTELDKLTTNISTTEKQKILNKVSKGFTDKWDATGVRVAVASKLNKQKNKAMKHKVYYDDVENTIYLNEDKLDLSDKDMIVRALAYANYDHFIYYYTKDKWNEWDLTEIDDYYINN